MEGLVFSSPSLPHPPVAVVREPKPLMFGPLKLATRYLLSPLAGYTNLAFRLAVRELGGLGLATTDLVNARALLNKNAKTHDLIATCPEDAPMAVQIFGSVPSEMAGAAQFLQNHGVASIDINMGCPVNKVTKTGGGSALMCNTASTLKLVQSVVEAVRLPVTVKMRLGWDDQNLTAPAFAREFEQIGVAAVIIHGRTREQGFSGKANLEGIRQVVEAVDKIPVIGNGDVRSIADAERMFQITGCAGLSIGRGALLNPWIFAHLVQHEVQGQVTSVPSFEQRLNFMARHYHLLVKLRGERFGSVTFRKIAGWYSKVLRPGKELHQRMMLLENVSQFEILMTRLREHGPPPHWNAHHLPEIAVPKGPNERW